MRQGDGQRDGARAGRVAAARLLAVLALTWASACGKGAAPLGPTLQVDELVATLPSQLDALRVLAQDPAAPVRIGTVEPGDRLKQGGGQRPGLVAPPRSRVAWRLVVPPDATLRFAVGVEGDGTRDTSRSAIRFTIDVDGTRRWTRDVDPAAHRGERRWHEDAVALPASTGAPREIVLGTEAAEPGRALAGVAAWGHVRVVRTTTRARQRADEGPSVLVVLVDTLRADRLGLYGHRPSPSPALDAFAARGTVFTDAVSQSSWTLPSVASLMTGLHPRSHGAVGVRGNGEAKWGFLPDALDTWAELAARAGITTVGVSTNPLVSRGTNVAQGFETFVELPWNATARNWAPAAAVRERFVEWLRANRRLRFAAWLHFMEPHDPYTPPEDLRPPLPPGIRPALAAGWIQGVARKVDWEGGEPLPPHEIAWLRALYDAEIAGWDREFGRLLAALDEAGVLDRTIVVVTADHGEGFQEHGRLKHGSQLYEELIHVPLVIVGPGVPAARVDTLAQGIDLAPTLLHRLGVAVPPALRGIDLLGPPPAKPRAALCETSTGIAPDGSPLAVEALRTHGWKLIDTPTVGRREVYDLGADPAERHDLGPGAPGAGALAVRRDGITAVIPPAPRAEAEDPAFMERLRTLGYVQ